MAATELTLATRKLASQLRIIFNELQRAHPAPHSDPWGSNDAELQHFARKYASEMYICAQQLTKEVEEASPSTDDAEELSAVFKAVGREVSLGTLTNMLRLADEDGSGSISFDEFAAIIAAI